MSMDIELENSILEQSFIALVYAVIGWALLEWWLVAMRAGLHWHLVATLLALILVFLATKRSPFYQRGIPGAAITQAPQRRNPGSVDPWSVSVSFGIGSALAALILGNGTLAFSGFAFALCFVPWMRLSPCRSHFGVYCAIIWSGSGCTLLLCHRAVDIMFLPIACWVLWLCASCALIRRIEKVIRAERAAKSTARLHAAETLSG